MRIYFGKYFTPEIFLKSESCSTTCIFWPGRRCSDSLMILGITTWYFGDTVTVCISYLLSIYFCITISLSIKFCQPLKTNRTLLLHKKHAKRVIKAIIAIILMKLAPIHGNNKMWILMTRENIVMFFTLREGRGYRISFVVKGLR